MKTIYYCYDAYCGWCYGFSNVIKKLSEEYKEHFYFEVLSGGMIVGEYVKPISSIASYIKQAYPTVEERTGIKFGDDFLWHINNPDKSDWFLNSLKPAIALCVFKEIYPDQQVAFAADLQYALNFEGRDLDDDEAYRHLLTKYSIEPDDFYAKLKSEEYKKLAEEEFEMCRQLQVRGFPAVLLQAEDNKFYMLSNGYTDYETMNERFKQLI